MNQAIRKCSYVLLFSVLVVASSKFLDDLKVLILLTCVGICGLGVLYINLESIVL